MLNLSFVLLASLVLSFSANSFAWKCEFIVSEEIAVARVILNPEVRAQWQPNSRKLDINSADIVSLEIINPEHYNGDIRSYTGRIQDNRAMATTMVELGNKVEFEITDECRFEAIDGVCPLGAESFLEELTDRSLLELHVTYGRVFGGVIGRKNIITGKKNLFIYLMNGLEVTPPGEDNMTYYHGESDVEVPLLENEFVEGKLSVHTMGPAGAFSFGELRRSVGRVQQLHYRCHP